MLRDLVPEYMVPQHLVFLEALPVTINGKLNRAALPAPELHATADQEYVASRNETEQMLADLWQDILGVGRIGIHDDFFQLGGHSLLAAKVVSRLGQDQGIALPMRSIFEAPTIARFAPFLATSRAAVRIPRRTNVQPAPASIMQRRILLLEQMDSGLKTFNLPAAWRFLGELDVAALQAAINAFVRRQDATRTTLRWWGVGVVQTILPQLEFDLTPIDLRAIPRAERESTLTRQMLLITGVPFDLSAGPLMRAHVFRLADEEHVLLLVVHHAIWDGWSFDIFVREIDSLYRVFHRGESPQPTELSIRYGDFAEWHNGWLESPEVAEQVSYWRHQLPDDLPPLELPSDRSRPKILGDAGATEWVEISRAEADALTALGRREGVTLFVVLLAAYETLLHRYSGQADFLVGTPVRGRAQPETEDVVGFFVNTVVLRAAFGGDPTFQEVLQRVRSTVLDALSHQDVPFEYLAMSRNPAYRAFFSFQDARNRPVALGNLALRQVHVLPEAAANDVSMWIMENESGLIGGLNYSTELFDQATMQRMLGSFRTLLRSIVRDSSDAVSSLPILSDADLADTVIRSGAAALPRMVHAAFEHQADLVPSAVALIADGREVTYAQLDALANANARLLRAAGIGPGTPVVLCVSETYRPMGLLAIAKAGGAAVLVDPTSPGAWIRRILSDAHVTAALFDRMVETADFAPELNIVFIDAALAEVERPTPVVGVDSLALIAYTLGADGGPLGVELSHATASAVVNGALEAVKLSPGDRLVATGPAASGRSFFEQYLALSAGAAIVAATPEVATDSALLRDLIVQSEATALHATPSVWQALIETGWSGDRAFLGIVSGEPVSSALSAQVAKRTGRAYSLYGQAETGFWSGIVRLPSSGEGTATEPLIGVPLPGVCWSVVDSRLRPVAAGVVGELLADVGGRSTRTGDLVRVRGDGLLEWRGRADDRVVLNGLRVEPLAIERALEQHQAVLEAAVAVQVEPHGQRLVGWIVPRSGADYTDSELRRALRKVLPHLMVPRRYVEVSVLPRRADGQVDRRKLVAQYSATTTAVNVQPRTDAERLLAGLWQEALAIQGVSVHDNFFDLGGHSLLCLQVIARIENITGQRLSPRLLLLNTLEQVAAQLESSPSGHDAASAN
jgi:non-ribosomal peptide synthetase component F